eukprot:c45559_g1_i1.p1 GENE.c45559_g1_i1~~c45559_g1_i1.p1  ORF type:complete len:402 (+),score=93.66 c45559_g1_i1:68-1207(+)
MEAPADNSKLLDQIQSSVFVSTSHDFTSASPTVHGFDFDKNPRPSLDDLLRSYSFMGFQATSLGKAIDEVNRMLKWRLIDEPLTGKEDEEEASETYRRSVKCTIFLGFTSNMISCGVREIIRFLAQHKLIDCMVTSGGGVEEDLMKCFNPFFHGDFSDSGEELRKKGVNRIGNLLVPNDRYCDLETWLHPILDEMLKEQLETGKIWSPSSMIDRFGERINNPDSVWYWCHKNSIPVYCPAITDGAIGDNIFFHSFNNPGLIVDLTQDIRGINLLAMRAKKTGMIILGGGVVKHHVCNANLMRNGADFSVFINTAQEFDGSDAGAKPDEAVSWGKIKITATPVKVYGECSLVFPFLVSQTFARVVAEEREAAAAAAQQKK